jgi:hypothetical protein
MSLYTHEEICMNCGHFIFHSCCDKFCNCLEEHESEVNFMNGECDYKIGANDEKS